MRINALSIPAHLADEGVDEVLLVSERFQVSLYLVLKTEGEVIFSREIDYPSDVDSILPNLTTFDLD